MCLILSDTKFVHYNENIIYYISNHFMHSKRFYTTDQHSMKISPLIFGKNRLSC